MKLKTLLGIREAALEAHPDLDIDSWLTESLTHAFGYETAENYQVALICETTLAPWENAVAFEKVVCVLNDRPVLSDIMQDLRPCEVAYAISELNKIYPDKAFNDDVALFVAYVAHEAGLIIMPRALAFAQHHVTVQFIDKEQETFQAAYLREIEDYVAVMSDTSWAGGSA